METETDTSIEANVKTFILKTHLPGEDPANLAENYELVEGGVLNSISVLSLVEFMEDEYDIMIEAQDLFRLTTVSNIATVIREKQDARLNI